MSDTKYLDITLWSHVLPAGWDPLWEPFLAIGAYFAMILMAKLWMMLKKTPYELNFVMKVHNVVLATFSAVMCLGLGWSVFSSWRVGGLYGAFCQATQEADRNIFWWMQIYHLSKWPEFLDTVFLVLKGRYVAFLAPCTSLDIKTLYSISFYQSNAPIIDSQPVDFSPRLASFFRCLGHMDGRVRSFNV